MRKIAVIGTAGVGNYGGFETLVENLIEFHQSTQHSSVLTIWCSGKGSKSESERFRSARFRYVDLSAHGFQSVLYDAICLWQAVRSKNDCLLVLGVSGAIFFPLIRLFTNSKLITNIDGIEWKRAKWGFLTKLFLRLSEHIAVHFSHELITDNQAIKEYVSHRYDKSSHVITYGGDHAVKKCNELICHSKPEKTYCLALCRIEPENKVHTILKAWLKVKIPLVFIGNWQASKYGRGLLSQYRNYAHITMLEPIYNLARLYELRKSALLYIHGHSAGGTNPSLVEAMHFAVPVIAYDCVFNRYTTEGRALYFRDEVELCAQVGLLVSKRVTNIGKQMREIAQRRYTWDKIGAQYFALIDSIL